MEELSFQIVAPLYLHDVWEQVAPDIDECRAHDRDETWLEDVYAAIRAGNAQLVVGHRGKHYVGMMVLTSHADSFNPRRQYLHIWFLNCHDDREALTAGLAWLEAHARQLGRCMLTFRGPRLAFERWGRQLGFHIGDVEMRREV